MNTHNTIFLLGPTASGKSRLAVKMAKEKNGVIINADSMQVYKGVDILTATPTVIEQDGIEHCLYGFVDPHDTFDVVRWRAMAIEQIDRVLSMGKTPILCGGTGFYATAMLQGLSPIDDVSTDSRMHVRKLQKTLTPQEFYAYLQDVDPVMAHKVTVGDTQRIARALEVILSTGNSLAYYHSLPPVQIPNHIKIELRCVMPCRQVIYDTINARYDAMIENGAMAEIDTLVSQGIDDSYQVGRAIGIRELLDYKKGIISLELAIEKAKTHTRRYAKRQITYINTQLKIVYS